MPFVYNPFTNKLDEVNDSGSTGRVQELVETYPITGTPATIEINDLSDSLYLFVFRDLIFGDTASSDRRMNIRVSTDNGSTWKQAANDYNFAYTGRLNSGAIGGNSVVATFIETAMSSTDTDTDTNTGGYAEIYIQNANIATRKAIIFGQTYSGDGDVSIFNGRYNTAAAVNAVQFLLTAGTFNQGTVYVYSITEG